ncbi:hypothetical protein V6N12_076458 [Hibiscus sabdariffa]|uniref:Uncharacterized protein n=1 Tax=Hibiscus sabdariffa TaxID=183260 RepID=A0ABR2D9W4_9ROSI
MLSRPRHNVQHQHYHLRGRMKKGPCTNRATMAQRSQFVCNLVSLPINMSTTVHQLRFNNSTIASIRELPAKTFGLT